MHKVWIFVGILALGALGIALVLKGQPSNAKTVTLEPNRVVKNTKPKNPNAKPVGSLEDLTKNAPEPRAVTTDAIVVPPKPEPVVSSTPEVVSTKPEVTTSETPKQVTKPVPEITKPIEQPPVSSTVEPPASQPSSLASEKPVVPEASSSTPTPTALPLRRSPGSVSIQAGAFKTAAYAETLRAQLSSQGFKANVELGEDGISRVIVGPYPNEEMAREAATKISSR